MTIQEHFADPVTVQKYVDVLGDAGQGYIVAVLNYCERDDRLKKAEPKSIEAAFLKSAALRLSFDKSINECYISTIQVSPRVRAATFNITYKGLIQLCLRSGKYVGIEVDKVVEGELKSQDMFGNKVFERVQDNDERNQLKVIGYVSYFKMLTENPNVFFEKTTYMSILELENHGAKYSDNFAEKWGGRDSDKFEPMAKKTVLKLPLDKFGFKTADLAQAIKYDQAKINEEGQPEYVDNLNKSESPEISHARISALFKELETKIPATAYKRWEMIVEGKEVDNYETLERELLKLK